MEKRRTDFWFLALAALTLPVWACNEGTRLESPRFVVAYKTEAIEVAKHFALDVEVCPKPGQPAAENLKVDAHMPEHRHGMNYAPSLKALGSGRWRAEGLMFHMPGRWELVFEVRAAGVTDRMTSTVALASVLDFSREEIARILQHGPWPPSLRPDASNRVSGKAAAIALGEK